ncbi:MAG: ATP-binding protein [Syntrophobacteraceae bacterium]|nr:ATP-binding protein [Syntrophobacteraceae bacterium]
MKHEPTLEDLMGIEHAKLGFFREVQEKIAELKASNLELARKKNTIQAILNGITDIMVVLSEDHRIVSVNRVFSEIFGDRNPRGEPCYKVFRGQDQPCSPCPVRTAREENRLCRQLHIYPVDGQNRHFEITASPLRSAEGRLCHMLVLKRDVTREMEYQAKFYQAERMATVGLLAAGVAHEINNPLTAISGFAEGLRRRLPRLADAVEKSLYEDFEEYVETILKECERCQDIVRTLLTFSRGACADFSPMDLNGLVEETVKLVRHHHKQNTQDAIRLETDASLPILLGDSSQIKQVVLNLLMNALDAVQSQGAITLRTFAEGEKLVVLEVEDTGCGIPTEHLDKLFEPFFTTKPVGQGIGIGLSTCYNIVRKHGGEILVRSTPGKGSTFQVRLPRND